MLRCCKVWCHVAGEVALAKCSMNFARQPPVESHDNNVEWGSLKYRRHRIGIPGLHYSVTSFFISQSYVLAFTVYLQFTGTCFDWSIEGVHDGCRVLRWSVYGAFRSLALNTPQRCSHVVLKQRRSLKRGILIPTRNYLIFSRNGWPERSFQYYSSPSAQRRQRRSERMSAVHD